MFHANSILECPIICSYFQRGSRVISLKYSHISSLLWVSFVVCACVWSHKLCASVSGRISCVRMCVCVVPIYPSRCQPTLRLARTCRFKLLTLACLLLRYSSRLVGKGFVLMKFRRRRTYHLLSQVCLDFPLSFRSTFRLSYSLLRLVLPRRPLGQWYAWI